MSISTQLTRMAQNVGALNADTNAIFEALRAKGVDVPANAQLNDVAEMIEEIEVPSPENEVEIGGRWYPYVQIGNYLWITENLDWKWTGLVIGTNTYPASQAAWYYNNNETDYGIDGTYKCGLLYNGYASQYLNNNKDSMLPTGWHVPTIYEWNTLVTEVGGTSSAGRKLKALDNTITSSWPSNWNGTDEYDFAVLPGGVFSDNIFNYLNSNGCFWSSTLSTYADKLLNVQFDTSNDVSMSTNTTGGVSMKRGYSLRLVKDAPGYVTIGSRQYKTVTIGSTLPIGSSGSPTTPAAWYYNNDESTYGINGNKYGLLYNWYATKYLEDNKSTLLPTGWHVASATEWDALANAVGGSGTAGTKLKSITGWDSGDGDGTYDFEAFPAGFRYSESFRKLGSNADFWTADEESSSNAYYIYFNTGPLMYSYNDNKTFAFSIRLVRTLS